MYSLKCLRISTEISTRIYWCSCFVVFFVRHFIERHKKRIPFNGILSSCGGRTRTCDLWVMSPTSYLCSTPRSFGTAKVVIIFKYTSFFSEKIKFLAYIWTLMSLIETAGRSRKGQVLLVLWWGFAECGFRKALRLRAQGVYLCKWPSLNVDNNAASVVLCNGLVFIDALTL